MLLLVSVVAATVVISQESPVEAACGVDSPNSWSWQCGAPTLAVQRAEEIAVQQSGKPYVRGDEGPSTFDCSGLVYYAFTQAGFNIDRLTAAGQYQYYGRRVPVSERRPGDLLFYSNDGSPSGISHVAIYLGRRIDNNVEQQMEALNPTDGIRVSNFRTQYLLNEVVRMADAPERDAAFVSQSVPSPMAPGGSYAVSVTMKNTGSRAWTRSDKYYLGTTTGDHWSVGRVDLPRDVVYPGETARFDFTVRAPTTPGTYAFQWQMLQEYVTWFGPRTAQVNVTVAAPERASTYVAQSVPSSMVAGGAYNVSVTMKNTGSRAWTRSDKYYLGTTTGDHWSVGRVDLPRDVVYPGETARFDFTVRAPTTPGTYAFQWQMLQEYVTWFGDKTPNVAVSVVAQAERSAAFESQTVPTAMAPGATYSISITMRNTGTRAWTRSEGYRLGSQNPMDNGTWSLGRVELPRDVVNPGESARFDFTVRAPAAPGAYNFQWQMLQEFVMWFGDKTPNVVVSVVTPERAAAFETQTVPTAMAPGATYSVSITMRNTGTRAWTRSEGYRLGSQNPMDNGTWSLGRVELSRDVVNPGESARFDFTVRAPAAPGAYNFQWQMLQEFVMWFGDKTPNVAVSVR